MRTRGLKRTLPVLALAGLMWAALPAGAETWPAGEPVGPAGWIRVDGQDHYLDEMLSLFRPKKAETLAIFAPIQTWKPFFDKIYGRAPIDLTLYAAVYRLSPKGSRPPSLENWPDFYQEDQDEPVGPNRLLPPEIILGTPTTTTLTFMTAFTPAGEAHIPEKGKRPPTTYTLITSLLLTPRQIFFLNLFQTGHDDPAEFESLALAWRADYLKSLARAEEPLYE